MSLYKWAGIVYSGVLWRKTTESRDGLGRRCREKVLMYAEHGGKRLEALKGAAHTAGNQWKR